MNNREKVLKCGREYARRIRRENPKEHHLKDRKHALLRNYGISLNEYNALLREQQGICAICGGSNHGYLCVDHDHKTNKIRGLLCHNCNRALGEVKDNPLILHKMIGYIESHNPNIMSPLHPVIL